MKKVIKIYIVLLCFTCSMTAQAQTIDKYLVDMPSYLMPALSSSLRLELMEYYKSEQRDSIKNLFGYKAKLLALDTINNYVSIQSTSGSRFEMKTFQLQDSSVVIGIINTVCAPVCSSYIHFFDKNWKAANLNFPKLSNENWLLTPEKITDGTKVEKLMKTTFVELSFNPANNSITARNNSIDLLSVEDQITVRPFVKKENILFKFNSDGSWKQITAI